jgi:hypothetical protein
MVLVIVNKEIGEVGHIFKVFLNFALLAPATGTDFVNEHMGVLCNKSLGAGTGKNCSGIGGYATHDGMDWDPKTLDFFNRNEDIKDTATATINVEFNRSCGNFTFDNIKGIDTLLFTMFEFLDKVKHRFRVHGARKVDVAVIDVDNTELFIKDSICFLGVAAENDVHFQRRGISYCEKL